MPEKKSHKLRKRMVELANKKKEKKANMLELNASLLTQRQTLEKFDETVEIRKMVAEEERCNNIVLILPTRVLTAGFNTDKEGNICVCSAIGGGIKLSDAPHRPMITTITNTLKSASSPIAIIKWIASNTYFKSHCDHYLIGSSSVYDLLRHSVDAVYVHKRFKTYQAVRRGEMAELAFYNEFGAISIQPSGRSKRLGFLCTTGDFISIINGVETYIEVKSTEKTENQDTLLRDKRYLLQVWITMNILGYKKGKLVVYQRFNNKDNFVKRLYMVDVEVTCDFLDKDTISKLISGYISFLESYFALITLRLTPECKLEAETIFKHYAQQTEMRTPLLSFPLANQCRNFANNTERFYAGEAKVSRKRGSENASIKHRQDRIKNCEDISSKKFAISLWGALSEQNKSVLKMDMCGNEGPVKHPSDFKYANRVVETCEGEFRHCKIIFDDAQKIVILGEFLSVLLVFDQL